MLVLKHPIAKLLCSLKHAYGPWYMGVLPSGYVAHIRDCQRPGCVDHEWEEIEPSGHRG